MFCPYHSPHDASCPGAGKIKWALSAWDRVSDQIAIRDFHMWSMFLPHAKTWAMAPRIRFFRDAGAQWYLSQVLGRSPDCDLDLYITARMLWDADRDSNAMVNEFFHRYFLEAATEMEQYYRYLNELCRQGHGNASVKYLVIYDHEGIAELSRRLHAAVARAKQPVTRQRIRREELALQVYSAMVDIWAAAKKWNVDGIRSPQVGRELKAAVEHMDKLLAQLDGKRIVAERYSGYWQGNRKGFMEIIAAAKELK